MSGTGRVSLIANDTEPRSNRPAQRVIVRRDDTEREVEFYIPPGPAPAIGDAISWGPHHAEFNGQRVAKLTWETDPNAPLP